MFLDTYFDWWFVLFSANLCLKVEKCPLTLHKQGNGFQDIPKDGEIQEAQEGFELYPSA